MISKREMTVGVAPAKNLSTLIRAIKLIGVSDLYSGDLFGKPTLTKTQPNRAKKPISQVQRPSG